MTRKPALLTAILLAALLAGCTSPDDADTQAAAPPSDPVSQALGDAVVAAPLLEDENATLSVDTPFLLPATTGPDAPITAFKWRVPKEAILEYEPFEGIDYTVEEIAFEMVPVFTGGAQPTEFAILFVSLEKEAYVMGAFLGIPQQGTETFALVQSTSLEYTPTLESEFVTLYAGEIEAGDEIGIVIVGKSEAAGDFGLLFSPMREAPDYDDDPANTPEGLLGNRSAATLVPSGTGAGFGFGLYLNENIVFATAVLHIEVTGGEVTVADRQRLPTEPIASYRDSTISASFDAAGYSTSTVLMFHLSLLTPNCVAAGTFDIAMDLHGTTVDFNSLVFEAPQASLASLVTGTPIAFAVGEGAGAATTTFTTNFGSSCGLELLLFEQMDLGATFDELFGVPAATGGAAFQGLAGNVPPSQMWQRGEDLVVLSNGRLLTLDGLGHVLDAIEQGA